MNPISAVTEPYMNLIIGFNACSTNADMSLTLSALTILSKSIEVFMKFWISLEI